MSDPPIPACIGSGTGGTNPGLPQDTDPKDALRTDRLDDPEELLQRRRAKDPAAFDKVHGKNASFAQETGGKAGGLHPTSLLLVWLHVLGISAAYFDAPTPTALCQSARLLTKVPENSPALHKEDVA